MVVGGRLKMSFGTMVKSLKVMDQLMTMMFGNDFLSYE